MVCRLMHQIHGIAKSNCFQPEILTNTFQDLFASSDYLPEVHPSLDLRCYCFFHARKFGKVLQICTVPEGLYQVANIHNLGGEACAPIICTEGNLENLETQGALI